MTMPKQGKWHRQRKMQKNMRIIPRAFQLQSSLRHLQRKMKQNILQATPTRQRPLTLDERLRNLQGLNVSYFTRWPNSFGSLLHAMIFASFAPSGRESRCDGDARTKEAP